MKIQKISFIYYHNFANHIYKLGELINFIQYVVLF